MSLARLLVRSLARTLAHLLVGKVASYERATCVDINKFIPQCSLTINQLPNGIVTNFSSLPIDSLDFGTYDGTYKLEAVDFRFHRFYMNMNMYGSTEVETFSWENDLMIPFAHSLVRNGASRIVQVERDHFATDARWLGLRGHRFSCNVGVPSAGAPCNVGVPLAGRFLQFSRDIILMH